MKQINIFTKIFIMFIIIIFWGLTFSYLFAIDNGGGGEQNYSCWSSSCPMERVCTGAKAEKSGCLVTCKDKNGNIVGHANCSASQE